MPSGSNASLAYNYESYYRTSATAGGKGSFKRAEATSYNIPFMIGAKLSSLERNNNIEVIYGLGQREATHLAEKQFSGSFSVDGVLSNPWFLIGVFGGYGVSGSSPYTHTISPAIGVASLQVRNNLDIGGTDAQWIYKGCVCTNCSINAAVGEVVTAKLDYIYATETFSTDNYAAQVADTKTEFDVYTFAHGSFEWNGSVIGNVQNVELSINPNQELVYGLGDRTATVGASKHMEYNITASIYFDDPAEMMRYFYQGTSTGTAPGNVAYVSGSSSNAIKLKFTNGLSGADERSILFTFGNAKINTDSLPMSPTELIIENVDIKVDTCDITAINNTQECPNLPA